MGLDVLEAAPVHAGSVTESLQGIGYVPYPAVPAGDRGGFEGRVEAAVVDGAVDVLIVHVVGHGELAEGSSEKLYLLGSDGRRLGRPVSTWIDLIEDHPEEHRPLTLFVLDVCYAGEAAVAAWHARMDPLRRRSWVLAATGPKDRAFGYRLSRALVQVLDRYRARTPRFDASLPHIPAVTVWRDVARTVIELAEEAGGLPQEIRTSLVPAHASLAHLPFFPNPSYAPGGTPFDAAGSGLPSEIVRLTDWAADPMHFMRRAGGAEPVHQGWEQGYFTGRSTQLAAHAAWLDDATAGPWVRVVTGKPGVGKSALLGILVCAAHPVLRRHTRALWAGLGDLAPGENEHLAVVHARRLSLDDIVASLVRQLRDTLTPCAEADPGQAIERAARDPASHLLGLLSGRDQPVTVVIDALDEAQHPADVTTALLVVLARHAQGGRLRLLVGTRDDERFTPLLALAREAGGITDLSTIAPQEVRRDVSTYVKQLLAADQVYAAGKLRPLRETLATAIAATLTAEPQPGSPDPGSRALQWGEFLTAGLYTHYLLHPAQPPTSAEEADRLGRAVPRGLPALLELDLRRHTDRPLLRPVLTALAHAQGRGMPESVLAHVATAFTPTPDDAPLPLPELYALLDGEARFYLRRDIDEDGTTLYRLFHEGLADALRDTRNPPPGQDAPAVPVPDPAGRVYERLLHTVPHDAAGRPRWHLAAPYLLRHAAQHATAAGHLDALLNDAGYLQHATPHTLAATLSHAHSEQARLSAGVYRASFALHHALPPAARRQVLALDAARLRNTPLRDQLTGDMDWQVRWATGSQVSTALVHTLTGHTGWVAAVAVTVLKDRPHAVTAGGDGAVRVFDLTSGALTHTLTGHTNAVRAVAVTALNNSPHAVTGSDDGVLRVFDLTTGALTRTLTGHTHGVRAVAVTVLNKSPHAVSGSADGTVRVWDLNRGTCIRTLSGHTNGVRAVAAAQLDGRPHAVTGSDDGVLRVFDLTSGALIRTLTGHTHGVRAVAVTVLNKSPHAVSGSADGTVRVWDLNRGTCIRTLSGHTNAVRAVAAAQLDNRPHAVTGSNDGTVRVWDLATGALTCSLIGHTSEVRTAAAVMLKDRPHVLTGSTDGTVRVWDLVTGVRTRTGSHNLSGHTDWVSAAAVTMLRNRPHAITASADRSLRVWDLTTSKLARAGTGHTNWVSAVAVMMLSNRPHAVTGSNDGAVRVWDLTTGALTCNFTGHTDRVRAAAVTVLNNRPHVVTGSADGTVRVSDLTAGTLTRTLTGHTDQVWAVAVTRLEDRPHALTGGDDGTVRVFDLATGTLTRTVTGHTDRVRAAAVTVLNNHPHVVTGNTDGTVRVSDLATGTPTRTLTGHTNAVRAVAVTTLNNSPHALTGSADGTVRLWNLTTGACLTAFHFPTSVSALAATPDATVVVTFGFEVAVLSLEPLKGRLR